MEGGSEHGADSELIDDVFARTGAYIMGKRMFDEGEVVWKEDLYKADVYVLTTEIREPWVQKGTTTFYFINDGIQSALEKAKQSANGKDIRIQGGANTIQQFLKAGLIDEFFIHIAPVFLGSGIRLCRVTYEIFAAHWPSLKDDPTADLFNRINKYVATKSSANTTWENTVLLNQDIVEQIKSLKLTNGIDLQVHGSGNLIQSLLRHGLIDQMNIWIYPLVIGKGKRLFADGTVPTNFKLVKHVVSTTGVIITSFEQDGKVPIGSFAS